MTQTSASFVAAMIQTRSGIDPVQNTDFVVKPIRAAADAGADYVQTPEMSNAVNRSREGLMASLATEDKDRMLAALRDLAREKKLHIHIGSLAVSVGDKVANRAIIVGPRSMKSTRAASVVKPVGAVSMSIRRLIT